MGYGAVVYCQCLRDLDPSTIPDDLRVEIDPCGYPSIEFADPKTGSWERLEDWRAAVCPHPDQEIASEDLANIWGMVALRQAVAEAGRLPILERDLPTSNDGCIPARDVVAALAELEDFRQRSAGAPLTQIIEVGSGEVIVSLSLSEDGVFQFGHGFQMGYDARGLYIDEDLAFVAPNRPTDGGADSGLPPGAKWLTPKRPGWTNRLLRRSSTWFDSASRSEMKIYMVEAPDRRRPFLDRLLGRRASIKEPEYVERFRSMHARQEPSGPRIEHRQPVTMTDIVTGATFESPFALTIHERVDGAWVERIPSEFEVVTIPRPIDFFDYAAVPLRAIMAVAIEHEAAVSWT